jgi:ADP-heptose:LPS heptosyltransferase
VQQFFNAYNAVYSWTGLAHQDFVTSLQSVTRGRARIFPFRPRDGGRHQADYYFCCLHEPTCNTPPPAVSRRPEAIAWRAEFWQKHSLADKNVLVVGPGSGARAKNWPEHHFCAVADWWRVCMQGAVVVLLGPVEKERGGFSEIGARGLIVRNVDLAQAVALLDVGSLYLGNDSGITHLAAATGIPAVALFGPSDPCQWAPRGHRVTVLSRHEECLHSDPIVRDDSMTHRCLAGIEPSAVIATLQSLLEKSNGAAGLRRNE